MLNRAYVKVLLLVLVLLSIFASQVSAQTIISIDPQTLSVDKEQNFTVDIRVQPDAPISGIQFNLSYNGSVVHVLSIEEGELFKQDGENTIFNSGSIDNKAGEVTGTYGFIVGKANISNPGVFISISFGSQDVDDRCTLCLSNVIVSNFTGSQIPVTIVDGSVIVGNPPQMPEDILLSSNGQSSAEGLGQNWALIFCFVVLLLLFAFKKKR